MNTNARRSAYACGRTPCSNRWCRWRATHELPVQVSLENSWPVVGGCAGCVVEVKTAEGPAMKRVCVDGPVFDGCTVF